MINKVEGERGGGGDRGEKGGEREAEKGEEEQGVKEGMGEGEWYNGVEERGKERGRGGRRRRRRRWGSRILPAHCPPVWGSCQGGTEPSCWSWRQSFHTDQCVRCSPSSPPSLDCSTTNTHTHFHFNTYCTCITALITSSETLPKRWIIRYDKKGNE